MTANREAVATVAGLVHRYGDLTAVDDLSFSIERGEVFGLLGPNGAGKSTTISILSCVLERSSGRVEVLGGDAGPNNRAIKARVGLVPQDLALYEEISGLDNLKFFGRLYGLSGSRLGTAIATALETVGLSDRAGDGGAGGFRGGLPDGQRVPLPVRVDPATARMAGPQAGMARRGSWTGARCAASTSSWAFSSSDV